MTENLPDSIQPFTNISPKAYEHPADRAATAALKAIPMLDVVVRKLIEWSYERALRQSYLGTSVKVSERQLPELHAALVAACRTLDMPAIYDLYVTSPVPGSAMAIGSEKPMIVIDSMLLSRLGPGEQRVVVAHELGHILSDHMVYMTALNILLGVGSGLPFFLGIPFRAVRAVLLEWYRAAELSCDRAAVLAVRDPQIVCRTLMVTAGAMPASQLNLDAFMTQAMEYQNWDDPSDRVRRFFNEIGRDHSAAVTRVSEVMTWVKSGEYDRIIRGEYRTRDQETDARAEAGDAMDFYAARFREMFREAGDNVVNLGAQFGSMAEQAADWIRTRGRGKSTGAEPDAGGAEPRAGGAKPGAAGTEPRAGGAEPGAGGAKPRAGGAEPGAGGGEGTTGTPDATGTQDPGDEPDDSSAPDSV